MPVSIIRGGKPSRRNRHNRREGYNKLVREFAPIFEELQRKGFYSAAQIAKALLETSLRTAAGEPYAESVIRGMLKRGQELGLPVYVRSRSVASSAWVRGPGRRFAGYRSEL